MRNLILIFLLSISSYSSAESCNTTKVFERVLGSWQSQIGNKVIRETWSKVSSKTFEGNGTTHLKEHIKSRESLRIVEMSGSIFYIAKVSHNPVPVAFKLVKCSNDNYIFKNEKHDFPKHIEYKFINDHKMLVKVSDGKGEGFTINFNRNMLTKQ